jgi:ABC-type branched-subunit amino acid transport system substrate-binding protein
MLTERKWLLGGTLGLALAGCTQNDAPRGGIEIGLLLPFTGSASATASNLERSALYAEDLINDSGGIRGTPVHIVSRDTHSDVARGIEAANAFADEGAVAVIGPESAEIAQELAPLLAERQVLFLSPLVGAAAEPSDVCDTPWFRLAPSAKALGEALAKQASAQGVKRLAILYTASPYDQALQASIARRFATLGGEVTLNLELDPNAQSYASEVKRAIGAGVTDVVLAASPRAAALVVNEFDALSAAQPRWFLSPLLKTDVLVQNVAPRALEGALGVAPKVYERGPDFPEAFSERWLGDQPLEGAYFYYDALALLSVALTKAWPSGKNPEPPSLPELDAAMLDAAKLPGEVLHWNELEVGLQRLAKDEDLYYSGLTGPLILEPCGARSTGITSSWSVRNGVIETDD